VRDWVGVVAPADTPQPVILRLETALAAVLSRKDVQERLAAAGFEPAESSANAFGILIRSELQKWGRVITDAGIKPD
jgi:tripartite-type tricarboxylate transporter receptor subunit TctC